MRILAVTNHGLSPILIKEFQSKFGVEARVESESKIVFEAEHEKLIDIIRRAQGIYRLCVLIDKTVIEESLKEAKKEIIEWIKTTDLTQFMKPDQEFAVRAHRSGNHAFRSVDIAAWAGEGIIKWFEEQKKIRPKVNLTKPEVLFRIYAIRDIYWLTLDITGPFAIERHYRKFDHPAGLRSQLGFLAVLLSGWSSNKGMLFDPTTGTGTIPIEASLYELRQPVSDHHWDNFLFHKWRNLEGVGRNQTKVKTDQRVFAIGQDRSSKFIKFAKAHSNLAKVETNAIFRQIDFMQDSRIPENTSHIVCNPPFGVRMGKRTQIENLYETIFKSAEQHSISSITQFLTKRNLAVSLAGKWGYKHSEEYRFYYGGITVYLIKFQR